MCFPLTDGISETLSPRTIVTGQTVAFDHHCKYGFGDNVQTHEPHNNSMGSHVEMASHENDDVEAEHKNNDVKAKMEAAPHTYEDVTVAHLEELNKGVA